MCAQSLELAGLEVSLDRLEHHHGGANLPEETPHAFVYYLTIRNGSDRAVTLLGRKWVVRSVDGNQTVIEGDKIVGQTPRLTPGTSFSYSSYHVAGSAAVVTGSFHGVDEFGNRIHVNVPPFALAVPPGKKEPDGKN